MIITFGSQSALCLDKRSSKGNLASCGKKGAKKSGVEVRSPPNGESLCGRPTRNSALPSQLPPQPGMRQAKLMADYVNGAAHYLGRLFGGHASAVPHLDQFGQRALFLRQRVIARSRSRSFMGWATAPASFAVG